LLRNQGTRALPKTLIAQQFPPAIYYFIALDWRATHSRPFHERLGLDIDNGQPDAFVRLARENEAAGAAVAALSADE
jgi:hypothetical protein